MKRRTEVPPRRMVQQDLFASAPPPAPALPSVPAAAVQAAAHVERVVRKKRSEAGRASVPFATGPVSDSTGGPLSAEEATRVVTGKTIRCSGYLWQDGVACCKACFDTVIKNGDDAGHGYRGVLYGGAEYKGGRSCFACKRSIVP